jgi:putative transcriptional regulator
MLFIIYSCDKIQNKRRILMIIYKKLWKLLIDKEIKKTTLKHMANISMTSIAKLGRNENVNSEIIDKICIALDCDVGDIMEVIHENNQY